MNSRQFIRKTILYSSITLLLIAILVITVDPFIRYHAPWFNLAAVETDERTSAIGLARNMEYDTALIGSSMSENFVDSWFEDGFFGNKCVKIPLQGGHYGDYEPLINEVINHEGTKNVVFCLDTYLFVDGEFAYPRTIEDYYIAKPGITDVYYLWNKSVVFDYIPKYLVTNKRENYSDANAYMWSDDYEYSKYAARLGYMPTRLLRRLDEKEYDFYFSNADLFTDAFINQINSKPDITFYLYVPPYSMLFWDNVVLTGTNTATTCVMEREFNKLLNCPNVRLFFFQNDYDIVTNLENYRDYSHYKGDINYYMYEAMRNGEHELTLDNYYDTLLEMYNINENYYYEQLFH